MNQSDMHASINSPDEINRVQYCGRQAALQSNFAYIALSWASISAK